MRSEECRAPSVAGGPARPLLSIGTFARRSRLSTKALRLYESLGLLIPAEVDQQSGYRRYHERQLEAARLIVLLRRLDMPLTLVKEVLAAEGQRRAELVASYWMAVERRIAFQRELALHLRIKLSGDEGGYGVFDIHEREVPEQLVLAERRHVSVTELGSWLPATLERLRGSAAQHGGASGPVFVLYHGEVNEDSDGPVEVCVPIGGSADGSADAATRREPAHREAYVRLTKAQFEYPQVLSAYDAVAQWVSSHGMSVAGSPREVWLADHRSAAPTDEVADIAFPIR